jgi:predicted permease
LFAAVGAVLLIACVNLANLQFARAVSAEHETAVRAALGASRSRQVMARLTESLILAVTGGMAGIALAFLGVRLLLAIAPANVPRLEEVRISIPVLLFAVALSMIVAVAFGILPALRSLRVPPHAALQANSSRTANARDGQRMRNIMVAAQLTCTVVLLIVTALSLRSFSHLMHQNRGFDASHVTVAGVDLFAPQYGDFSSKNPQPVKLAFADHALAALRQLPGVESSALTSAMPLKGETWVDYLHRPDHPLPDSQEPLVNVRFIDPSYLPTMRIPVVAGRNLSAGDRGDPYVALISERTAREAFPGEDPIGRKIGSLAPNSDHLFTVVGVVADTRINGLKDTAAMAYAPYWVFTHWTLSFLVRSSQPSDVLIPEIRRTLWKVDPQVAIPVLKSIDEQVSESAATDRFQAIVLSGFGISALLLALLGVYGVLAYSVSLRQQEFGIRIALGSGKGSMVGLVLRQAAYPVLFGTAAGLAISFVVLRWVRSLLYQTPVMDPLAIGGSVLLLIAISATAAMIPAYRAASVDPMRALRSE